MTIVLVRVSFAGGGQRSAAQHPRHANKITSSNESTAVSILKSVVVVTHSEIGFIKEIITRAQRFPHFSRSPPLEKRCRLPTCVCVVFSGCWLLHKFHCGLWRNHIIICDKTKTNPLLCARAICQCFVYKFCVCFFCGAR